MYESLLQIFHVLVGLTFVLFIPGYLLTLILFNQKEIDVLERFLLAIVLSICISVLLGLLLGFGKEMKGITGGITESNVWFSLIFISGIFAILLILKKTYKKR